MKHKKFKMYARVFVLLLALQLFIPFAVTVKAANTTPTENTENTTPTEDNGSGATATVFQKGKYYFGSTVSSLDCTHVAKLTKVKKAGTAVAKCTKGGSANASDCEFDFGTVNKNHEFVSNSVGAGDADSGTRVVATETSFGEGDQLTHIFETAGFQGSAKALSSASIVGKFMGYLISYVCLAILCFTVFQIMITMLYLSAPVFWNKVDSIQAPQLPSFGNNRAISAASSGLNTVVSFIFKQVINVKELSDYSAEGATYYKLDTNRPTMSQYFAHRSLQIVLVIFFASIGYNGALLRAYGVVVSGMGQAIETVIDTDLAAIVDDFLNSGTNYKFNYNADGSKLGDLTQTAMRQVYANCISTLDPRNRNAATKSALGAYIDSNYGSKVKNSIKDIITSVESGDKGKTDSNADADDIASTYKVEVFKSSNPDQYGGLDDGGHKRIEGTAGGCIKFSVSKLINGAISGTQSGAGINKYVYVYVSKMNKADYSQYMRMTSPRPWTTRE